MNCDLGCKDKLDLVLKLIFVGVFTYGVMSAVCCMKSCSSSQTSCSKAGQIAPAKQCGANCQKPCCNK